MRKLSLTIVSSSIALAGLLAAAPAQAQAPFSLALKASPLGGGIEAGFGLGSVTGMRLAYQGYSQSDTTTEDQVKYDTDTKLSSGTLLFDLYPKSGLFRATLGAVYNKNRIEADGDPSQAEFEIGDNVYPGTMITSLTGEVTFSTVAPYIGVGFSNAGRPESGFLWGVDVGAVYQGSPEVDLRSTLDPTVPADVAAQYYADLATEEKSLEEDFDSYKWLPILSFSIGWRF